MTEDTIKQLLPLNSKGNRRGMHPNARKALDEGRVSMKPGETLNPAGLSITARARLKYNEVCPFDSKGRTWAEAEAEALLRQALKKTEGMRTLLDRHEGPVEEKKLGRDVNVVFIIGKGYQVPQIVEGKVATE